MRESKNKITRLVFVISIVVVFLFVIFYFLFLRNRSLLRINPNNIVLHKNYANLSIDMSSNELFSGKSFKVSILLDTKGNYVNAVSSYLKYNNKDLKVKELDTSNSFCKYYIENSFDNENGIIKLSCGSPYPGFRGENILETIEFVSYSRSETDLEILPESMILSNDGLGTNLLKIYDKKRVIINTGL